MAEQNILEGEEPDTTEYRTDEQLQQEYDQLEAELTAIIAHPDFTVKKKAHEITTLISWLHERWDTIPPERTTVWRDKICTRLGCSVAEFNIYLRNPSMLFSDNILYKHLEEDSFLRRYLTYTLSHEAPEAYQLWIGMAILSAALNRNYWLGSDTTHFKIFPNLYVLLIGPPAQTRKGGALDIGLDIFRHACPEIRVVHHFTAESLIKELGEKTTGRKDSKGKTGAVESQALVFAPELKTVMGRERHKENIVGHLTELYDCQENPMYTTVTRAADKLHNVYLTFLAGTTEDDFRSYIPAEATTGGFTSRLIMVICPRTPRIATQDDAVRDPALRAQLIEELRDISLKAKGVHLTNSDDGKRFFKSWYTRYKNDINEGLRNPVGQERFDLHVQKIAVLLSASEHKQELTPDLYKRAITLLDTLGKEQRHLIDSIGTSPAGKLVDKIKTALRTNGGDLDFTNLMRKCYRYFQNPRIFRDALDMLQQAKVITVYKQGRGRRVKLIEGF